MKQLPYKGYCSYYVHVGLFCIKEIISVINWSRRHTQPFYGHHTGQSELSIGTKIGDLEWPWTA